MEEVQLGFWGRIGAWLHLWTPPRGAVVPPAPWRWMAAGVVLVALAGIVAVVLAGRHAGTEHKSDARQAAARHAALLAQVARTETPHLGTGDLAAAKAQIGQAARGRKIVGVDCQVFPRTVGAVAIKPRMTYDCTAVTARFQQPGTKKIGVIGVPFRLAINTDAGRFAFCQIIPLGDRDRLAHPLPAACLTPPAR